MEKQGLSRQRIFAELSKSPHGKLAEYVPIGKQAIEQEGEFFQHLIAWNARNGQIRDSKTALPMLGVAFEKDAELLDNSLAHLAKLNPRELYKAFMFLRELRPKGKMQVIDRLIRDYLHQKEADRGWDHIAIQHGSVMRSLYAYARVKPTNDRVRIVIFGHIEKHGAKVPPPRGSVFEAVANLKKMSPTEAAGAILKFRIPFLIAAGALEEKAKEPELVQALMSQMSPTELTTNMKMLEKMGVKTNPALRGALDKAMEKAASSKQNTLKTTAAIMAENPDGTSVLSEETQEKLRRLQKKQIAAAGGPDGDWLVLVDRSPSMEKSIEFGKHVAASLAQFVKGKVWMIFFDSSPMTIDVTGLSLDQVKAATRHIGTGSATSIGCGLNRMLQEKTAIDGIAIVSDGQENTAPLFPEVYKKYAKFVDKDVPVYFYHCAGGGDNLTARMNSEGIEMQTFDLRDGKTDYYAIPNLVQTMRSNPYSLIDEIMAVPLLSLSDVLKNSEELVGA